MSLSTDLSLSAQISSLELSQRIEEILDDYIQQFNETTVPAREYSMLNRTALRRELSKYWCPNVYREMTNIIRTLVSGNQVINQLMSTITDLKAISVNSAEGNVFIGGVQHIDKLLAVKYNKISRNEYLNGIKHEFVIGSLLNTLRDRTSNFIYTYYTLACPSYPKPLKGDKANLCESGPGKVIAQHLLIEYIEGRNLYELLSTLSVTELAKVFLCVFCSLAIANDAFHFCHGDLHAGNIMIRIEPRPVTMRYVLPDGRPVLVNTKYVPVIIDYGFSRATYKETEIVSPSYRNRLTIRGYPEATAEEHPYLDFYKLVGFVLASLRNSYYTNAHREFFMGWIGSLRMFMTVQDYNRLYYVGTLLEHESVDPGIPNILRRDDDKYPEIPENLLATDLNHFQISLQQTYYYPTSIETRHLTYLNILEYLIKFADTHRISELKCITEQELIEKLYPTTRLPCNGESSPGFDKNGNVRTLFDCAKYFYDGTYNVIEIQQGTNVYHGSSSMIDMEFPLGNDYYSPRDIYDEIKDSGNDARNELMQRLSKIELSTYSDLAIARDKSKMEGPDGFLCSDKCTYSYVAKKNMTFLDLSNPQTLIKLIDTLGEREAFLFTLYHGEIYNYITPAGETIKITPNEIGYINVALNSYTLPDNPSKQHFRLFAQNAVKNWKAKFIDLQKINRSGNLLDDLKYALDKGAKIRAIGMSLSRENLNEDMLNTLETIINTQMFISQRTELATAVQDWYNNNQQIVSTKLTSSELNRYSLTDKYHPLNRVKALDLNRSSMSFPEYILPKILMEYCEKNGYTGYAYTPMSRLSGEIIPGEIVLGSKVKTYLKRNYDDPYDWHYNDDKYIFGSIGKLLNDMKEYKTTDTNTDAGDLYEHSVWTALFVQWMYKVGHPSVQGIRNNSQLRKIVIAAAFLHDIGKAGDHVFIYQDKVNYPEIGANYVRNNTYLVKDGSTINIHDVIREMGISLGNLTTLVFLIRWQWDIGSIIRENQREGNGNNIHILADKVYRKFVQMCNVSNISGWSVEMRANLFTALYVIWSADVMASQPFIGKASLKQLTAKVSRNSNLAGLYFNEYLEEFPYIANLPKVHRGSEKYKEFGIQDVDTRTGDYAITGEGLLMRNVVVQKIYSNPSPSPSASPPSVDANSGSVPVPVPIPVRIDLAQQ